MSKKRKKTPSVAVLAKYESFLKVEKAVTLPCGYDNFLFWARRVFNRCQWCNTVFAKGYKGASRDHILPKCKGGKNSITNLLLSCYDCNNKRGCGLPPKKFYGPRWDSMPHLGGKINKSTMKNEVVGMCTIWKKAIEWVKLRTDLWQECIESKLYKPNDCIIMPEGIDMGCDAHEYTSVRAYYKWQEAGEPYGMSDHFWSEAERELKQ